MDYNDFPSRKNKTRRIMKTVFIYLTVILILTLLSSTIDNLFIPEVSLVKIQKGKLNTGFETNGYVAYGDKKKIFAPCNSEVEKVYVKPGETIISGTPLADIEPEDVGIKTDQYELQIMRLEDYISGYTDQYTLRTLPEVESRLKELTEEKGKIEKELLLGDNTPDNVDLLNDNYTKLLNMIDLAQKEKESYEKDCSRVIKEKNFELEILKEELEAWKSNIDENGTVYSNIAGTVLTVAYGEGEKVSDGQMMFEIIGIDSPAEVICNLSTEQSSQVKIGDIMIASLKEYRAVKNDNGVEYVTIGDSSYKVTVTSIEFNDILQGIKLKCLIKPRQGVFMEGGAVKLELNGTSNIYSFVVPNSAISSRSDGDFVYSVRTRYGWLGKEEYVVCKISITVESDMMNSAIYAEGLSGLSVISDSTIPLEDGMRVKIK